MSKYDQYHIDQIEKMQEAIKNGEIFYAQLQGGNSKYINVDNELLEVIKKHMKENCHQE